MSTMMRIGGVLLVSAGTTLAACGGNKDATTTDTASAGAVAAPGDVAAGAGGPTTPADSGAANASPVPASTGAMTDPEIVTLTQAADEGEIATSKIAQSKATNAEVRAYAQQMVREHTKMIADRNALVKAQNVTPSEAANDSSAAKAKEMVAMLEQAPKGAAFDTAYVNGQVLAHTATLAMVQKAQGAAQNAELKGALEKAAPVVQKHLDEAKALQGKLAGTP